jgi:subtilisin family serine protease
MKAVLALGPILAFFTPLWAEGPEGLPGPERLGRTEHFRPGRLIVKFRPEARAEERGEALAKVEAALAREIPALSLSLVSVPPGLEKKYRLRLAGDPAVEYVELDHLAWVQEVPSDPEWDKQWGLEGIGAPAAWDLATGGGDVTIAILDTGVDLTHPDLAIKLWVNPGEIANGLDDDGNGKVDDIHGWNFASDPDDADPSDDHDDPITGHSHGTHVAGIAAAATDNGVGIAGVSWGARLMAVKVLDSTGSGYYSDVADGMVYAVDEGAKVLNLSLGGESASQALQDAVEYVTSHGALVMGAAGNCVPTCSVIYPAAYPASVAIAATDGSDLRAWFSSYGPEVDVAAPGVNIYSTVRVAKGSYAYKSGTSMATPHVSGLAALLWSYRSSLTGEQVRNIVETRATDVNSAQFPCWDRYLGWGRIDAHRTLSTADDVILYPCRYFFPWVAGGTG